MFDEIRITDLQESTVFNSGDYLAIEKPTITNKIQKQNLRFDSRNISSDALGDGLTKDFSSSPIKVDVDNETIEISDNKLTIKASGLSELTLADGAVTASKVNQDVAGPGLAKTNTADPLSANVDDESIEIFNDELRLKDDGIANTKYKNDSITFQKINADVAGDGLIKLSVNDAIDINIDDDTIHTQAGVLQVKDLGITNVKLNANTAGDGLTKPAASSGLTVNTDGTTLTIDSNQVIIADGGVDTLQLANDSVAKEKINADVAGDGLKKNTTSDPLSIDVDNVTTKINGSGQLATVETNYPPYAVILEQYTSGTNGPTWSASTWNVRTVNTIQYNTIGLSLSADEIIELPSGVYKCYIYSGSVRSNSTGNTSHKARLRDTNNNITLLNGTTATMQGEVASFINGVFTINDATDIRIEHYTETNGNGMPSGGQGEPEVYLTAEFWKIGEV